MSFLYKVLRYYHNKSVTGENSLGSCVDNSSSRLSTCLGRLQMLKRWAKQYTGCNSNEISETQQVLTSAAWRMTMVFLVCMTKVFLVFF